MEHEVKIDNINEKISKCSSPEDILELAKNEGLELSDSQLEEIAGGSWKPEEKKLFYCPFCGADTVSSFTKMGEEDSLPTQFLCNNCNRGFTREQAIYK